MARTADLLTIRLAFDTQGEAARIARELQAAGKITKQQADQIAAIEARNQQTRHRRAVEDIKGESRTRVREIEAQYQNERRNVQMILRERRLMGEITERQMQKELRTLETGLARVRQNRLSAAPGEVVMGNRGRLGDLLGVAGMGRMAQSAAGSLGLEGIMSAGAAGGPLAVAAATVTAVGTGMYKAAGQAIDFEDQMAGVARTSGLTGEELEALGSGLLDLSAKLGLPQQSVVAIAESAASLGIEGSQNILSFSETVARFSIAADMSADEAANALAKTGSAFHLPVEEANRLGSAIDQLADTTSARARDIVSATQEVGASGYDVGLTAQQVAALAATLIDAGVDTSTAGTSIRNVLTLMVTKAEDVARVAGMTEQAWIAAYTGDPLTALQTYLAKLRELPPALQTIEVEKAFGQENVVAVKTLAGQTETLTAAIRGSQKAYEEGTRLAASSEQQLDTVHGQWERLKAGIAAAGTELGEGFLPILHDVLEGLNYVAGQGETTEEALGRIGQSLDENDESIRALERYRELLQSGQTETDEFRQLTDQLTSRFPALADAFAQGTTAAYNYAGSLLAAAQAQRELMLEERRRANQGLAKDALGTLSRLDEATTKRDGLNASLGAGDRSGFAMIVREQMRENYEESSRTARQEERQAKSQLRQFIAAYDLGTQEGFQAALDDLAGEGVTAEELGRLRARAATWGLISGNVSMQEVVVTGTADPRTPPSGSSRNRRTRGNRGGQRSAEAEARRATDAADRLREAAAARAAEQIADEYDRQVDQLKARYEAERQEINATAEAALKPFKNRRNLTEAENTRRGQILLDQKTAIDALGVIEQREIAEVEQARSKAAEQRRQQAYEEQEQAAQIMDERLRMAGMSESGILTMRMLRLQTELAAERDGTDRQKALLKEKAQLQLAIDREAFERRQRLAQMDREAVAQARQYELDALSDAHAAALLNIESERERERVAVAQRQQERRAAAEAAYQTEMERIRDAGMTEVEARRATAAAEIALDQGIEDARRDGARETAELQRRLEQERLEQMRGYVNQAFDVIVQAGQRERRYTDAQIARERRGFGEQEDELKKSLRQRRITTQEFNDQMAELAERRAAFEKDAAADSASFVTDVLIGLVGVAKAAALEIIKAELAKAATTAVFNVQKGGWGKAAAGLGGPLGVAALAAATFAAVWGLEKVIRSAGGFAGGGYTGRGGRHDVAGFAHRGEVIMEAPIVSGQEQDWLEIRRLAQSGVPARAFLDAAQVRAAMRPALPQSTRTAAVNAFDDRRLVATGAQQARELAALRRDVQALANRPVEAKMAISDADARRLRYAAEREDRRVDPRRKL